MKHSPFATISIIVLAVIGLIVLIGWFVPVGGASALTTAKSGGTRLVFLAALAGAMIWGGKQMEPLRQRIAMFAVLALMALDVLTHAPRQNPTVPNRAYSALPIEMSAVPKVGESRAMISPPMQRMLESAATPDPLTLFTGYRRMLLSDCNMIDRVPKVNGFFSLYLREANQVNRQLYRSTNYVLPLLDFLGVSQISDAEQLFAWHARSNAMPLVSAGQSPVFSGPKETFEAIFAPTFDPRRIVYLAVEAQSMLSGIRSNACQVISITAEQQRISAKVEATDSSVVVISQAFYHPWKAYVNGKNVPLWKANYAYAALAVPEGRHEIELRYEDRLFRVGAVISIVSLISCGIYLLVGMRRRDAAVG